MVFSGEKRTPLEEQMERLKLLHNFDLPCLKWGNQKLLRCMKVDSASDVSIAHRRPSPESLSVTGTRRRFRSSDDRKLKAVITDGEIEATREKLMFDFQTEVGKMKDAILRGSFPASSPAKQPETTSCSPAEKPWNLRTRRAVCNGDDRKPNVSPARNENECNKYPAGDGDISVDVTGTGEKREREKFSVTLSRRELEEDYTAMTGRRLPRKPKKRPRVIQRQLDTLFPGLWLSEISADLYRVPDDTDTGKR